MSFSRNMLLSLIALVLTVPWFFSEANIRLVGMPTWALYAVVAAVVYSIILFIVIEKTWPKDDSRE